LTALVVVFGAQRKMTKKINYWGCSSYFTCILINFNQFVCTLINFIWYVLRSTSYRYQVILSIKTRTDVDKFAEIWTWNLMKYIEARRQLWNKKQKLTYIGIIFVVLQLFLRYNEMTSPKFICHINVECSRYIINELKCLVGRMYADIIITLWR